MMAKRPTRGGSRPPARAARSTARTAARSGSEVSSRAAEEGQRVATRAADEAQAVASTAQEQGRHVARVAARQGREVRATAKEQVERVRGEVVEQGRTVLAEARGQVETQAHDQTRQVAERLARVGDEARALAEGRPDDAQTVRPYVTNAADALYDAADRVYTLASDIDERGLTAVLDDLQAFARRRPGAFLLGAAVAGFAVGRTVRASSTGDGGEGRST